MKKFLLACLISGRALAQAPTPESASPAPEGTPLAPAPSPAAASVAAASPTPEPDPALAGARQFALNALDLLYSGQFQAVADLMNPNPPKWKGTADDLRKARSGDLNTMAQNRSTYGLRLSIECIRARRVKLPKRPDTELFYELAFKSTYGDRLTATDLLIIMQKDGHYYVERFE